MTMNLNDLDYSMLKRRKIFLLEVRHSDCKAQQKSDAITETLSTISALGIFQTIPRMKILSDLLSLSIENL